MKKIISIILSLALLATCLLTIPFTTQAKVNGAWNSSEVFNATKFYEANQTYWMGIDKASSLNQTAGVRYRYNTSDAPTGLNAMYNGAAVTLPIIENANTVDNGTRKTDIKSFNWEFSYRGPAGTDSNTQDRKTITSYFMFHVDKDRAETPSVYGPDMFNYDGGKTSAGLDNMSGFFAVVYRGNGGTSTDGLMENAFNVIQPTLVDGEWVMRPIEYTESNGVVTPAESSYVKDTAGIVKREMAISIKLEGNTLTLKVVHSWATYEKVFKLSQDALDAAPSGDFAFAGSQISVANNDSANSFNRDNHLHSLNQMVVSELTYATNDEFAQTGLLFDSTDSTDWLGANTATANTIKYVEKTNNTYQLYGGIATTNILAQNGVPSDVINGVENFVWEFDLCFYSQSDASLAFLFHVNDNSVTNAINTNQIKNALGVVINGSMTARQLSSYPNSIRISSTGSGTGLYMSKGYSVTDDDGTYQAVVSGTVAKDITADVTYKVRIAYNDGVVQVVFYDPADKAGTYASAYYEYTAGQIGNATAGDFAIVSNWARNYISNMKIWVGDNIYPYAVDSNYEPYNTKYTFDEDVQGIAIDKYSAQDGASVEWNEELGALQINTNSVVAITEGYDNGNNNLGDFVLKTDLRETHHWSKELILFRKTDSDNYYKFSVVENGADNADNTPYHAITLSKTVDGVETVLNEITVGKSALGDNNALYTIVIEAIGDTITIYFAEKDKLQDMPIMVVKDDSLKTGLIEYRHFQGTGYIYDMDIYDLTAKAFNDDVAAAAEGLDRARGRALEADYNALHSAQVAKLTAAVAAYENTVTAAVAANEETAMNANSDSVVDICDLVALNVAVDAASTITADPEFDGVTDGKDLIALRKFLLGIKHY